MKYILMDVEGTTTSIRFVHDVLFPYSFDKMDDYVKSHPDVGVTSEQLKAWIKEDKKEPLLKKIQGEIWQQGYESGELKGHLYADVPKAFSRWLKQGLKLAIYSSGSLLAQKLLFKHSEFGDLDQYISANFDTRIGHKREAPSYSAIAAELKVQASDILFLSDISEELMAAKASGLQVKQLCRDGMIDSPFEKVSDFDNI